jgi:hypothetical protein
MKSCLLAIVALLAAPAAHAYAYRSWSEAACQGTSRGYPNTPISDRTDTMPSNDAGYNRRNIAVPSTGDENARSFGFRLTGRNADGEDRNAT